MSFVYDQRVRIGPFTFSLSEDGVEAAGFHAEIAPKAVFISVATKEIFYRRVLKSPVAQRALPDLSGIDAGLQPITSGDVLQMVDASSEELLALLNRNLATSNFSTLLLAILGVLLVFVSPSVLLSGLVLPGELIPISILGMFSIVVMGLLAFVGSFFVHRRFRLQNTVVVLFEMEPLARQRISELFGGLGELKSCEKLWHISSQGAISDWKRNAGAGFLLTRDVVRILEEVPPKTCTNVSVLLLPAGREHLYFLPDRIWVHDRVQNRFGTVRYDELEVEVTTTRFIESDRPPSDAEVIDQTWEKVNRGGGPDLRFANNRRLPVCRYGELTLKSRSGLLEKFQFSRANAADQLIEALIALGAEGRRTG